MMRLIRDPNGCHCEVVGKNVVNVMPLLPYSYGINHKNAWGSIYVEISLLNSSLRGSDWIDSLSADSWVSSKERGELARIIHLLSWHHEKSCKARRPYICSGGSTACMQLPVLQAGIIVVDDDDDDELIRERGI